MTAKPVMAYVAEPSDIKELVQRVVERASRDQQPLSFYAAAAEHRCQEMHLGKVIRQFLIDNNGRQGKDWVIRHAPENRYFVLLSADHTYLDEFAARLDDTLKMANLRVSSYKMALPNGGTPAQIAEEVYEKLSSCSQVEDAVFTQA